MSVELLREAAKLMRERAEAATPMPWRAEELPWRGSCVTGGSSDFGYDIAGHVRTRADNAHIASWHPAVALAVAAWLENVEHRAYGIGLPVACEVETESALAVARTYLGRDS